MLNRKEICEILVEYQFTNDKQYSYASEYEKSNTYVYVKNNKHDLTSYIQRPLVIHPENDTIWLELSSIDGVEIRDKNIDDNYYKSSSLKKFPPKIENGEKKSEHGIAFDFSHKNGLRSFLEILLNEKDCQILQDLNHIDNEEVSETERSELKKARIGQGKFRKKLIADFKQACAVTKITRLELLKASHIKPWRSSDNSERLNSNNGILLSVHLDELFDAGFISFDKVGKILISNELSSDELKIFNIKVDMKIEELTPKRLEFLCYHRDVIFKKA